MLDFAPNDLTPLQRATMEMVVQEEDKRIRAMRRRWHAYETEFPKPLKATKTDPRAEDNTLLPYCQLIVDTVVSWLFGDEPIFDLDKESTKRSPEEEWLDQVWDVNKKMLLLQKAALNGSITGHVFLKLQRSSTLTGGLPRIILLDSETVRVIWSDEDIDDVKKYIITWNVAATSSGKPGVRRQTISRQTPAAWLIVDEETDLRGTWREISREPWPYPFPPVVDSQHLVQSNAYYGRSDIEQAAIDLNEAINFATSNNNRVVRIHGHPKVWGKGFGQQNGQTMEVSPDAVTILPSEKGMLATLNTSADLAGAHGHLDRLKEALLTTNRIPLLAVGEIKSLGQASGIVLQILFLPLIQKIGQLRLTYGGLLNETNRRMLVLGKQSTADRPTITWPAELPEDMGEKLSGALLKEQLGVSKDTILQELGYDPEEEAAKRQTQATDAVQNMMTAMARGTGAALDGQGDAGGAPNRGPVA